MNVVKKFLPSVALLLLAITASVAISGCGYGEISDNAYDLATATYGACMAQDMARIERVKKMLEDEAFAAGLTTSEIGWFELIIDDAQNEDWETAASSAKRMLEDQVHL